MRRGGAGAAGAGGESAVVFCVTFGLCFLPCLMHSPKSPRWLVGLALSETTSKTSRGVLEGNIKYLCGALEIRKLAGAAPSQ